jgi:hypothetical protein
MKADLQVGQKQQSPGQCAKREEQIDRVMQATVGMYGDFHWDC